MELLTRIPSGCLLTATAVPSLGLLSKSHVPAPSPHVHWQTPFQAGVHKAVAHTISVGLILSCCHRLVAGLSSEPHKTPVLSQLISPPVRGHPQMREPPLTFSCLPGVQVLSCLLSSSFSLLLSFVLPGFVGIFLFRCPRSSASVQQLLCENCRCILNAFVGRDEFHVLLFL